MKWGIIGPGTIAANFATGLGESDSGTLDAIASTSADRRAIFGDRFGVAAPKRYDTYDALLADPEVQAVYIATPHPFHAQLALNAIRAGKAVLCEKPGGLCTGELTAITEAAAQEGVFYMEGLMYRAHPQIARLIELLRQGTIGDLRHIRASFGFEATVDPASRLFNPALAGGAILDVGIYPVSLARLVAGVALGTAPANPTRIAGLGIMGETGVDQIARAHLLFDGGITAEVATAVTLTMENDAVIIGTKGQIRLPDPWTPGRNEGPSDAVIEITIDGTTTTETLDDPRMLFAFEAEAASRAIAEGATQPPFPLPDASDSLGTLGVLDAWRRQAGYQLPGDTVSGLRHLSGTLPKGLPPMRTARIDGLDRDISQFIIGCDNRDHLEEGAIIWDAWMEAGGNAFDTGFVYGGGLHEQVLGKWLKGRGVQDQAIVIVKGAHTPYCTPRAIETQLDISLDRLGLDHAPIYIMHRDNPDVPVGEFLDVLNGLQQAGRIGIFGASNWTITRFAKANALARANGQSAFSILNNNLSLAVMERPVWPGCLTANTPQTLDYLRETGTAHLSWSSQARGFFVDPAQRTRLPTDTAPDTCYASAANDERRRRASELAAEKGVAPHHIAAAWVLAQSFPSFALIGPRTPGEIATTLPALDISLSDDQTAWLNLES